MSELPCAAEKDSSDIRVDHLKEKDESNLRGNEDRKNEQASEPSAGVKFDFPAYKKILKNRGFLALWVAQGVSGIGDWVIVGVLLDKVNRYGGATGLAWMMTFRFLPAFLFGLMAGAIVDRLERKTTLVFCDFARGTLVFLLAFSDSLPMICGLVFGIECFSLVFGPARDSSIPDIVDSEDIVAANSLMSTSTYLTMALGTMIATVILGFAQLIYKAFPLLHFMDGAQFQHRFAFIVDALSFFASAMLIFTISFPRRWQSRQKISRAQMFKDMSEGIRFMRSDPLTRSILGVMIIGFIGGGSLYVLGAPFARQVMAATGAKFTLILTCLLAGVVLGAALAPMLQNVFPREIWFGRAVIGFGLVMLIFTMIDFYPLCLIVIFFGGILLGFLLVTAYTMLHENLSNDVRGRVFAAMQTIMRTCLLISMGIFAVIARLIEIWIPWKQDNPAKKVLNLGFMEKSFYPAMIALMIGAFVVIIGGWLSVRSFRKLKISSGGGIVEGDNNAV